MTDLQNKIEEMALINDPKDVTFKHNKKSTIVFAPLYSWNSAVLDKAYRFIESVGGKFNTHSYNPYAVKFTLPNN